MATIAGDGSTDREAMQRAVQEAGIRMAEDDNWSDLFSRVLVEKIEPFLGIGRATILCEYPTAEAALARKSPREISPASISCFGVVIAFMLTPPT